MLTFDTTSKVIESTASIPDLAAFHAELRDWEDGEVGAIHPVTHSWRALDLGGGAVFQQLDLINGWKLKFPSAGTYTITGNLNGQIVSVPGVYVERKTSAAFVTGSGGSGGSSADPAVIAQAVIDALNATMIPVDARRMNGAPIVGTGTPSDKWRGAGV